MKCVWSEDVDAVLSVGRTLKSIGVRNWALDRQAALAALERLATLQVAVLGGDVYAVRGESVESNYDSWYCTRDSGEGKAAFVVRSIAKAKSYIANYKAATGSVLFAMVPNIAGNSP